MILEVFTVFDAKIKAFMSPFYERSIESATRAFDDACNKPDHPFYAHPEDYTLFHLGSYDDQAGSFTCPAAPTAIVKAAQLRRSPSLTPIEEHIQKQS